MAGSPPKYIKAMNTYYRIVGASDTHIKTVLAISDSKRYEGREFLWTREEVRANIEAGVIVITELAPPKATKTKGQKLWS